MFYSFLLIPWGIKVILTAHTHWQQNLYNATTFEDLKQTHNSIQTFLYCLQCSGAQLHPEDIVEYFSLFKDIFVCHQIKKWKSPSGFVQPKPKIPAAMRVAAG